MSLRGLAERVRRLGRVPPPPAPADWDERGWLARMRQLAEAVREAEEHPQAIDMKAELIGGFGALAARSPSVSEPAQVSAAGKVTPSAPPKGSEHGFTR